MAYINISCPNKSLQFNLHSSAIEKINNLILQIYKKVLLDFVLVT